MMSLRSDLLPLRHEPERQSCELSAPFSQPRHIFMRCHINRSHAYVTRQLH